MKTTSMILAGATTFAFVSCENPADKFTAAKVSEAKEVSNDTVTGKKWVFTEESSISFTGSKVTGSHSGGFTEFSGHFYVEGDTLAPSGHKIVIDMDSTYSDAEKLTEHLKNADFFNVESFPESTFVATGLEAKEAGSGVTHTLTGNFTLHGVTKSIDIPVVVTQSSESINVKADFFIDRFDFDVAYAGRKDDLIRKEVVIKFDLNAVPATD